MDYDIIFAGGGATACVTAGRLAAADPSLKILILETGPHTLDVQTHVQPARYFSNLALGGETFTHHVANPSEYLLGRSVIVPSGRALGGGSSVNFMVYTRAAASDYDDWENVYGNKGWGSKHMIPLLKKAETYQSDIYNDTHGDSGPIKVSMAKENVNIAEDFLEVAAELEAGRGETQDINAFFVTNKYGRWARYIDIETGRRSDTAHNYIYDKAGNTNLVVMTRQRVVRVIIENRRAIGVEYVDDKLGRSKQNVEPQFARASKLVVLSAGAFGSPSILERSGIGSAQVISKLGIPIIVDLPGVGANYMDHNVIFLPYCASEDAQTLDAIFRSNADEIEPLHARWVKDGSGLMSHNSMDAGMKLRPNNEDLKSMSPEFDKRWSTYFAQAEDKTPMLLAPLAAYCGLDPTVPPGKYFSMAYFTGYPVSTGQVHITSADPYARLDFDSGFLSDPADVVILRWAYKKARELSRRSKFYRGEVPSGHPKFSANTPASIEVAGNPKPRSSPFIVYSEADDKAIDEFHQRSVETTWHSMGTCAMKSQAAGGVVDERLNVYGIAGLKIADCSISPANVAANTYNTAIGIGEKAAVIIAEDLGILGV